MEMPVYVFSGLLDSGKTNFINTTIQSDFTRDCKTLLIVCEEGDEEYDEKVLAAHNVVMEVLDDEDDINVFKLNELERKHKPDQIIIEHNGMWSLADLEQEMPANWSLYQIVVTVDATTFELYVKNMGAIIMEKLMAADMIVFNRATPALAETLRKRNLKLVNRRAQMFIEFSDGDSEEYDDGSTPPFDLDVDVIEVSDDDFGIWFVDCMDHLDRYVGKKVKFKAMAAFDPGLPEGCFGLGRHAMVCCEEDVAFYAVMCDAKGEASRFRTRDWVEVVAVVGETESDLYVDNVGPVLYPISIEHTDPPRETMVSF